MENAAPQPDAPKHRWIAAIVIPISGFLFLLLLSDLYDFERHPGHYPIGNTGPAAHIWAYQTANRYYWSLVISCLVEIGFLFWTIYLLVQNKNQRNLGLAYFGTFACSLVLWYTTNMVVIDVLTAAFLFFTGKT